jgi:hypothetical protein
MAGTNQFLAHPRKNGDPQEQASNVHLWIPAYPGMSGGDGRQPITVMRGLDPRIHVLRQRKTWMPGTRPGMTMKDSPAMTSYLARTAFLCPPLKPLKHDTGIAPRQPMTHKVVVLDVFDVP